MEVSIQRFVLVVLLLSLPASLYGQVASPSGERRNRVATVTAGIGNALGWFGLQGERYLAHERLSAFVGVGYTPEIDFGHIDFGPSGPTFAAGVRGFTPGYNHRGFFELSVSQVVVVTDPEQPRRLYGPGLQAGYQFVSGGGFTLMISAGVGYAPGVPESEREVGGLLGLSLGYTWRC